MSPLTSPIPHDVLHPIQRSAAAVVVAAIACVIWAVFAPLSTTLSVNGFLLSERPSLTLQHPHGGEIEHVLVNRHEQVAEDQVLLQLDATLEKQQLAVVDAQITQLQEENAQISRLLSDRTQGPEQNSAVVLQFQQTQKQAAAQMETAAALSLQIEALEAKTAYMRQQLALMEAREQRQQKLLEQGHLRRTDGDVLAEQILMVEAELQNDRGTLLGMRDQLAQTESAAELIRLGFRGQISARREQNLRVLEDLTKEKHTLKDRINRSTVRAPVAGTISEMNFEAAQSYAPRGATLFQISQPIEQPHISFVVPMSHVDQLSVGMSGRLIVPGLPQRNFPKIDVEVSAISPRAQRDEAGQPVGYRGRAELAKSDLDRLKQAYGQMTLAQDMPVQLIIEVRETTFADYLVTPFLATFDNALQD